MAAVSNSWSSGFIGKTLRGNLHIKVEMDRKPKGYQGQNLMMSRYKPHLRAL